MPERLSESDIFKHLLQLGKDANPKDGAVTAALVRDSQMLFSAPSTDSGAVIHAEHNMLEYARKQDILILPNDTLYTTLEPCSGRFGDSAPGFILDCTSMIIASGVKNVIYAAEDPVQAVLSHKRFEVAGVRMQQTKDQESIARSRELFNSKVRGYKV